VVQNGYGFENSSQTTSYADEYSVPNIEGFDYGNHEQGIVVKAKDKAENFASKSKDLESVEGTGDKFQNSEWTKGRSFGEYSDAKEKSQDGIRALKGDF
jgi:hypothetical protein